MASTEKEFTICKSGITTGNLLCSYLRDDKRICVTGYQCTRDGDLVIKIITSSESADVCIADAIKKCKEDLNHLITSWVEISK
jgi:DNA-directed RNA polymerase subunit L